LYRVRRRFGPGMLENQSQGMRRRIGVIFGEIREPQKKKARSGKRGRK
jgi:hypothetical protein